MNNLTELINDFEYNITCHYLEDCNWDLNINPDLFYSGRKYSPEEELLLTMYVLEEMPYLKLYQQDGETKFTKVAPISEEDQLIYYKQSYLDLKEKYFELTKDIQRLANRM